MLRHFNLKFKGFTAVLQYCSKPLSLKVSGRQTLSKFPEGSPMERDARLQSIFYLSFRVPSKGALPPRSPHRTPIETDALLKHW